MLVETNVEAILLSFKKRRQNKVYMCTFFLKEAPLYIHEIYVYTNSLDEHPRKVKK